MRTPRDYLKRQTVVVPTGEALGYFAGLIDGEGSLTLQTYEAQRRGNRSLWRIMIYNTNYLIIRWLLSNVGGQVAGPDKRGSRPCWCWQVSRAIDVMVLLRALVPIVIEKRDKARAGLALMEEKYGNVDKLLTKEKL